MDSQSYTQQNQFLNLSIEFPSNCISSFEPEPAPESKHYDQLAWATQHTVSTFCSTFDRDDASDCWTEDGISLSSLNEEDVFTSDPLLDLVGVANDHASHRRLGVYDYSIIDEALRVASAPDDSVSVLQSFQDSQESLYKDYEETYNDGQGCGESRTGEASHFDDSMNALNDAFEKLNHCMLRTAQSRKLVRELTESMSMTKGAEVISGLPTCSAPCLKRTDSSSSVCSLGSRSSLGSKGSVKGRRSYNKPRRAFKKGTFSKTGVAPLKSNALLQLSSSDLIASSMP